MLNDKGYRITVNGRIWAHAPTMDQARQIAKRAKLLNWLASVQIDAIK